MNAENDGFHCGKCGRKYNRKDNRKRHEKKCDVLGRSKPCSSDDRAVEGEPSKKRARTDVSTDVIHGTEPCTSKTNKRQGEQLDQPKKKKSKNKMSTSDGSHQNKKVNTLQKKNGFHCGECGKKYMNITSQKRHEKGCKGSQTSNPAVGYNCRKCGKYYKIKKRRDHHQSKCLGKPYRCDECQACFFSRYGVRRHFMQHHGENTVSYSEATVDQIGMGDQAANKLKCHTCGEEFAGKKELHTHQLEKHREFATLQREPWGDGAAPWQNDDGEDDNELRHVYEVNEGLILRGHEHGQVKSEYNFPTQDLEGGVDEVMNHLGHVYQDEDNAFKVNVVLGMILKNTDTEEYRYFVPYENSTLFEKSLMVTNSQSLDHIRRRKEQVMTDDYLRQQRPDTKWKCFMVTNIVFQVYRTSYPLGEGIVPEYIRNKKSVLALDKNRKGELYDDHLCIFRCLAKHKKQNNMEQSVETYYAKWREYIQEEHRRCPEDSKLYRGDARIEAISV